MSGISTRPRHFASDNYAGICPEAFAALAEANADHEGSYGEDRWTRQACDLIREVLETDCEVFFVFNGTSANALSLAALCQSYHSVLCHRMAHVETAECGAPEFFSNGAKVQLLDGPDGKIDPAEITRVFGQRADLHFPKPRAVTLTQATETGTLYSPAELGAICERTQRHGLRLHMDGARFANAVAALGVKPRQITWEAGVEVFSFGATKNGVAVGEAVVFFNRDLAREFEYRCKQAGQLASKMRFLSAPWVGLLRDGAWLRHAAHSNAMARRLEAGLRAAGAGIAYPVQTNAVFVRFPDGVADALHARGWHFYTGVAGWDESRLMCSWDTTPEDVDGFVRDAAGLLGGRTPAC